MSEQQHDWTAEFEALADAFYRETGIMAPGKSVPLEMAGMQPEYDERSHRWRQWLKARGEGR